MCCQLLEASCASFPVSFVDLAVFVGAVSLLTMTVSSEVSCNCVPLTLFLLGCPALALQAGQGRRDLNHAVTLS